ncbi:hypothetical protein X798_00226 [Onchocerca flexuosa]|uniref:Uncharacterized protein n=1 Tax=Onchocerca flexuosa TaxID=387005 RepID=A0A238C655_9BILA|nr:hypothetical protein X798_00226 [Onchocerca flexuosa]
MEMNGNWDEFQKKFSTIISRALEARTSPSILLHLLDAGADEDCSELLGIEYSTSATGDICKSIIDCESVLAVVFCLVTNGLSGLEEEAVTDGSAMCSDGCCSG